MDVNFLAHGFVRAADGKIKTFEAPGAGQGTVGLSVNAAGGHRGNLRRRELCVSRLRAHAMSPANSRLVRSPAAESSSPNSAITKERLSNG